MHLPIEIWELIAAYDCVSGMAGASKTLRAAWYQQRKCETNPHVAFVRRSRRDIKHILFCNTLDRELRCCPQRQLSCWNFFSFATKLLNEPEQRVLAALCSKLGRKMGETIMLEFSNRGAIIRTEGAPRRCRAQQIGLQYDSGRWSLYMRLVLLPAMTRNFNSFASLSKDKRKITTRRPWRIGKKLTVLRSRAGLNAIHCMDDERPSTKGAFEWLCTGVSLQGCCIDVATINEKHPLAEFVVSTHKISASDLHVWETDVYSWP